MKTVMAAAALALTTAHALPGVAQAAAVQPSEAQIRTAEVNGVTIAYRVTGPARGRPIVLLPGIGMQLIEWPQELVRILERGGFRVIALDLRDSGGSTRFTDAGPPDWAAILPALGEGRQPQTAYTADAMATDVINLLDHLKIARADILGISGGATIGELIAADHPERVRSLAVIAANSGNPAVALPADAKQLEGMAQPAANETADAAVARRVDTARRLAGRGMPFDTEAATALARQAVARNDDPFSALRQGVPLLALRDLRPRLATIGAPTLVVHGGLDPLVPVQLGREVANAIPGAIFLQIPSMGHDLPARHVREVAGAVLSNARRAR